MELVKRVNEDIIETNFHEGFQVSVYEHNVVEPTRTYEFRTDDEGYASATFGRSNEQDITLPRDTTVDEHHGTLYLQKHAVVEVSDDNNSSNGEERTITDTLFLAERSQNGTFCYAPEVHHSQHPDRHLNTGDYALHTVNAVPRTKTYLFPGTPRETQSWNLSDQFAYNTAYTMGLTILQDSKTR